MKVDKNLFKDGKNRYITQSLFLELGYNTDLAVYTLDGEDKVYKGKTYPSLKKRFLEMRDPEQYLFASEHLFDWGHWKRIRNNNLITPHVEEWEEELSALLRSEGIQTILEAADAGSYQAGKWLNDRGWEVKKAGRPSKADVNDAIEKEKKIKEDFGEDVTLLEAYRESK
ncbi:MAG: hypothetical protein GQ574_14585 [Crocinitomix sp.]|nr:hypothetical protein [Crocinitomix sp.]